MAQDIPRKDHFQQAYEGKAPWDIGKPQSVFVEAADQIAGSVLDVGCGTGENALFLAQRGQQTTGIDCGLFHVLSDEDRARYVNGLASVVKPGGKMFMMCFSDREPPGDGPRRVSQAEIHDAFAKGWNVESIKEARFETRPDMRDIQFSEGGPFAWFCVIRKSE